jgi:hypothetical protein
MKFPWLLLIMSSALTCCAAYKPSIIQHQEVRNPTIGFYGFSITFPVGYRYFQVIQDKDAKAASFGQTAWRMALDYNRAVPGLHTEEIIVFEGDQSAIALGVSTMRDGRSFTNASESDRESFLRDELRYFKFPNGEEFLRTVEPAGKRKVAKLARIFGQGPNKFVNIVYIAHGRLTEKYTLNGVSHLTSRERLLKDMDAIMASLITEKSKKGK